MAKAQAGGGETIYTSAGSYLKSFVWKTFGFYKRGGKLDKTKAICKLCRTEVPYTSSTTNLKSHLERHHQTRSQVDRVSTLFINRYTSSGKNENVQSTNILPYLQSQLPLNSPRAKAITASIARFIATVLYCTVLYCTVLYCAVLCCAVLYCAVLYCAVL